MSTLALRSGRVGASRQVLAGARRLLPTAVGLALLFGLWWIGGWALAASPRTAAFADFAPGPALAAFGRMVAGGDLLAGALPSLKRVGLGLLAAAAVGIPLGFAIGSLALVRKVAHVPFQFLRMISPLAWMPIAVLALPTWDGAIVFLIAVAAVWPVIYSTASGLGRLDPTWLKVARNLGAPWSRQVRLVLLPAVAQDILAGLRLALGIAWVVLVPAEYLGVTSGLGYGINDARDTLEYDRLAAIVLAIGIIGFVLDGLLLLAIRRVRWQRDA